MSMSPCFTVFLSIQAQDFIEDGLYVAVALLVQEFLSIQAQDFIEESETFAGGAGDFGHIPEHSSSGLH